MSQKKQERRISLYWYGGNCHLRFSILCSVGVGKVKEDRSTCICIGEEEKYCLNIFKGEDINRHFEDKTVGTSEQLPGVLDGEKFDLFCMKDNGYVMTLMSTYGSLQVKNSQRESVRDSNGEACKFKYTEVVANHFDFRGAVDFHNSKRHDCGTKHGLSIEETWRTTNWALRVFGFIIAITEVNAFLAMRFLEGLRVHSWNFVNNWRRI